MIARSDNTKVVEGNHYFPRQDVSPEYLEESPTQSTCPWKGEASYYHVKVDDEVNKDAAWCYLQPKDAARQITDHIAFWKGVKVVE